MPDCAPLDDPSSCWLCARPAPRGELVSRWIGHSYTDQNRARCPASRWICEACVWCCAWSRPPGFPVAEGRGVMLRLFSHLYCERAGGEPLYLAANKADKPWIRAWLAAPKPAPWFCAIADSGQKHVLPWTPINLAPGVAGVVRFEERDVRIDARVIATIDATCALLTDGATKEEIERGVYRAQTWTRLGAERIRAYEHEAAGMRNGAAFALVVWLAQRDEDDVAARIEREKHEREAARERGKRDKRATVGRAGETAPRGVRARSPKRVSPDGSIGTHALDADRAAPTGERAHIEHSDRVGEQRGETPAPPGREQLALFGNG